MNINYDIIIKNYKEIFQNFINSTKGVEYEKKGILYSEVAFLLSYLHGLKINRLLESGRARAQSTLLFAKNLPNQKIISIEYEKGTEDDVIAKSRLKDVINVELMYGNSIVLLPEIIESGDAVFIDGPKMFPALRLAFNLLATGKPIGVFIHDISMGTPERKFLNLFLPECLYSDSRVLAEHTSVLDKSIEHLLDNKIKFNGFKGKYGYGYCLALIPHNPKRNYRNLILLSHFFEFPVRVVNKIRRTFHF